MDTSFQRLPIVIGVTGHRDVRPSDEPALATALEKIFARLQADYPYTPLLLLTPLAEGADRLAAEVALRLAIPYRVPLPMPLGNYREDFAGASRTRFERLLAAADGPPYEMPFFDTNDAQNVREPARRAEQYAVLAVHLGRASHLLIALWDGVPSERIGGTAQAVRFRVLGAPERYLPVRSVIDAPETGPVHHVYAARSTNAPLAHPVGYCSLRVRRERTDAEYRAAETFAEYCEQIAELGNAPDPFATLYQRIDAFNRDCTRLVQGDVTARTGSATQALRSAAERIATHYQKKFVGALQRLYLASALALVIFESYENVFTQAHPLVALYLAASAFAIWTYAAAHRGRWQDRAQDYRALELGLNVQHAWDAAGLGQSVADFYIRRQRTELDWIRDAIRTAHDVDRAQRFDETHGVETVRAFVLRQYAYFAGTDDDRRVAEYAGSERFAGATKRERRKAEFHERLSRSFLRASFACSVGLAAYGLVAWFAPLVIAALPGEEALHGGLIFAISLTAIGAALFNDYPNRRAHPQHARRYAVMGGICRRALDALDEAEHRSAWREPGAGPLPSRIETARACIRELGHEALSENGDWLLLHRELPIELLAVG